MKIDQTDFNTVLYLAICSSAATASASTPCNRSSYLRACSIVRRRSCIPFSHGLLKDRAATIRGDLDRARDVIEKAEAEKRDLTPEEKAATEPVLKEAKDIAAGFRQLREEDAAKEAIKAEFADVLGPLDGTPRGGWVTQVGAAGAASRAWAPKVATAMLGPDGAKALRPWSRDGGSGVRGRSHRPGSGGTGPLGCPAGQAAHQPGVLLPRPDHQNQQRRGGR